MGLFDVSTNLQSTVNNTSSVNENLVSTDNRQWQQSYSPSYQIMYNSPNASMSKKEAAAAQNNSTPVNASPLNNTNPSSGQSAGGSQNSQIETLGIIAALVVGAYFIIKK